MIHLDAGQLRTPVRVLHSSVTYTDGFSTVETSDALGFPLYVQWIEAHGRDMQPTAHLRRAARAIHSAPPEEGRILAKDWAALTEKDFERLQSCGYRLSDYVMDELNALE